MQKNIIALAIAAAFAAPAAAMADAVFYGSMDGGMRHQTNSNTGAFSGKQFTVTYSPTGVMTIAPSTTYNPGGGGTTDTMQMGQYNTARWGFKVVEDMGDGMKANVVLETSFAPGGVGANNDLNTATTDAQETAQANPSNPFGMIFDRQATLGLEGSMGKFDMGWNYTTSFKTIATYDPMNYKFLAVAGAKSSVMRRMTPASQFSLVSVAQDRAGSFTYTNKFGDVGLALEYDVNNTTKTAQPGGGVARAIGLTYASGPINAGFAYTAVEASAGQEDKVAHMTAGAGFNFGDGKVSVGYAKNTVTAPTGSTEDEIDTNMWAGVSYNVSSATTVSAAYYKNTFGMMGTTLDTSKNTMIVAATYALSKKTSLYLEMDRATFTPADIFGTGVGMGDVVTLGTSAGLSTVF